MQRKFWCFLAALGMHMMVGLSAALAENDADDSASLSAVIFDGVSAYDPDVLLAAYEDLLGQPVSKSLRASVADAVVEHYRDDRYLAPHVEVTEAEGFPGVLMVAVAEASIGRLRLNASDEALGDAVRKVVSKARFSSPLHERDVDALEAALRQIDSGHSEVQLVSSRAKSAVYDLMIDIVPGVSGSVRLSDEGSDFVGRERWSGALNIVRPGDLPIMLGANVGGTLTNDDYLLGGVYLGWMASPRFSLMLDYGGSQVEPSKSEDINSVSDRDEWTLSGVYRHRVNGQWSWSSSLSLAARQFERSDDISLFEEDLRIASLSASVQNIQRRVVSVLSMRYVAGIDGMGAEAMFDGEPVEELSLDFDYVVVDSSFWFQLPAKFITRLSLSGQYSNDLLPGSQTFAVGGSSLARAYEPGELAGDKGTGANLELRRPIPVGSQSNRLTPYAYYGVGEIDGNFVGSNKVSAASAGVGMRWQGKRTNAYIEVDQPLTRESSYRNDEVRANAALSWRF